MRKWFVGPIGILMFFAACAASDDGGEAKVLRHVVLFKFKDNTPPEKIKEIEDGFRALPGKISVIKDFEWGTDIKKGKRPHGFSHCFLVTFADKSGLATYSPHPAHQAFVKLLKPHLDKCFVIDYWAGK